MFKKLLLAMLVGLAITACGPSRKTILVPQASTATPTPTGDGTTTVTLKFAGEYDPTKQYHAGDVVIFNGKLYFANVDVIGIAPPGAGWQTLNGADGANGANGTNGLDGAQGPAGPAGPPGLDGISGITTVVVIVNGEWWCHCTKCGVWFKNGPPGPAGNPNHDCEGNKIPPQSE